MANYTLEDVMREPATRSNYLAEAIARAEAARASQEARTAPQTVDNPPAPISMPPYDPRVQEPPGAIRAPQLSMEQMRAMIQALLGQNRDPR